MPPRPSDSLGSIFSPNPRYLSNCSVGASVLPSPAGVQLFWVPRPGEGLFASVRQAEKQKISASSVPTPAGHLTGDIGTVSPPQRDGQHPAGQARAKCYRSETTGIKFPRDFASTLVPETIQFYCFLWQKCLQHHVFPGGHPSKY